MSTTTKISIRISNKLLYQADAFAKAHRITRSRAIELFAVYGIERITIEDKIIQLEDKLRLVYQSLVKQGAYLCDLQPFNDQKFLEATASSEMAVKQIFENAKE